MEIDWYEFVNKGMCSLCGQSGIINTTGVATPAGLLVGRLNWCICPNGRALKEAYKSEPTAELHAHYSHPVTRFQ